MDLEIIHVYLFGGVKYLDLLMVLMAIDIVTGIFKAIKLNKLRSLTSWLGYARKIGTFGIIIVANVIDIILGLNGMVSLATVLFYMYYEILSITENAGQLGMKVPSIILDKLQVIHDDKKDSDKK
jgi:toxin secretion/phage lysis holin